MNIPIDESEAHAALDSIAQRRHEIVTEIDVPTWYWSGMAAGWIALGVVADLASPWASTVATVLFGAAHASIAGHVLSGRRASPKVAVHRDIADRRIPFLIIGLLCAMVVVTVAVGVLLHADGARHPSTWATVMVALLLIVTGPTLMDAVRRRADRGLS
jgi:hypothetical protein